MRQADLTPDIQAEIEAQFKEQFPGQDLSIKFAGDADALGPDLQAATDALLKKHRDSLVNGTCIDCGAKMENWPEDLSAVVDTWQPPKGWAWFTGPDDEPIAWQCPNCDAMDPEGVQLINAKDLGGPA
jgi:hypothetical protein